MGPLPNQLSLLPQPNHPLLSLQQGIHLQLLLLQPGAVVMPGEAVANAEIAVADVVPTIQTQTTHLQETLHLLHLQLKKPTKRDLDTAQMFQTMPVAGTGKKAEERLTVVIPLSVAGCT